MIEARFIKRVAAFSTLSDEQLDLVAGIARECRVPSGQRVMAEGEAGDTMYIICEGQVEVSRTLVMKHAEGEFRDSEKVLSRLDASRQPLFGEMALFGDFPRTATVTTLSECLFYEIGRADFLQLMESHPRLGVKVLTGMARLLSHRLKKTDEDVIRLTTALSIALSK